MELPQHHNPKSEDRTAYAPYNFVPLPPKVVTVLSQDEIERAVQANTLETLLDERLPPHDRYVEGRHSGYFDVTLTTETPLYIRAPLTPQEYAKRQSEEQPADFRQQVKNKSDFFYTQTSDQPVIPSSSLRGMLRSLVEIVGYGKMQWVTDKRLFFRSVDTTIIGKDYRARMGNDRVETGFLRKTATGYVIAVCNHLRVHREKLNDAYGKNLYEAEDKIPKWTAKANEPSQYKPVWVTFEGKFVKEIFYNDSQMGTIPGILVITGDVPPKKGNPPKKKKEFVFLLVTSEEIQVPQEKIDRFNDDDQITQWQQKAFPKNKPANNSRRRNGVLQENSTKLGEPVFFLRENGALSFFGRAGMFRLPYLKSPYELIPDNLRRSNDIDLAEALFGFTDNYTNTPQGHRLRAYASRISVTDATPREGQTDILDDKIITPPILSTPKPTSFQHYLVQSTDIKEDLKHYDSNRTTIRGHKLYWHHGRISLDDLNNPNVSSNNTQHTQFRSVLPRKCFSFKVHFENLSDLELGLLAWVLMLPGRPEKEYRHKLGMGKPFGLGAIKLEPHLYLISRQQRYTTLIDETGWISGEDLSNDQIENLYLAFEQALMQEIGEEHQRLYSVERIKHLLTLLEWYEDDPTIEDKQYMQIKHPQSENQYRHRPVLPTPKVIADKLVVQHYQPKERIFQIGTNIRGKVIDLEGDVLFSIIDAPDERMIGIMPTDWLEGRKYALGGDISAIVVQIEEHPEDDEILVYCRPKPKKQKA